MGVLRPHMGLASDDVLASAVICDLQSGLLKHQANPEPVRHLDGAAKFDAFLAVFEIKQETGADRAQPGRLDEIEPHGLATPGNGMTQIAHASHRDEHRCGRGCGRSCRAVLGCGGWVR